LKAFIQVLFPLLNETGVESVLQVYAIPEPTSSVLYATLGDSGPTALNQSVFGTGYQQAANNLYAETTFVCPSYWLASAYDAPGKQAWKYQFSVPPAEHGEFLCLLEALSRN
jgi:hypothetical protein